ncbi:MAG: AarF/ABC1/UbiB kinase family protein [Pyrinomonadaceae bacterium]|nr:AarF/ABC1/UbiB kinase family protein [Pyrinomonadaceae bacterium]
MNIEHLRRYKDIGWLLMKYGRSDLVKQAGIEEIITDEQTQATEEDREQANDLAQDLESLGSTYIKLGQLLSTRADLLPPAHLEALSRLQDNVEPFSFAEVERIISSEIGVRISRAFSEFDDVPLAAASLGQVHRARLRDGREVVVKVQRPGIREKVVVDLETLDDFADLLDEHTDVGKKYEFGNTLEELRKSLLRELDYTREAGNLNTLAENLKDFENIVVPRPVEDFTTSKVLTMEFVSGKKITDLSPLSLLEIDRRKLAEELFHAYLKQMLVDGFFHADPHPGNIYITKDGKIGLLDLGMVGQLMSGFRDNLMNLLLAISEGRGEEVAQTAIKMGAAKDNFNEADFKRQIGDLVATQSGESLGKINAGRVVLKITKISAECGFRMPPEFTLIAKTFLNLDRAVYALDPDFDPNESIRRHSSEIMQKRMVESLSPGNVLSGALEVKEFIEKLPSRVNNILDVVGNNELQVKVDAIDEKTLMVGFQKIANRITLGLVLAALIVGASMLMRVESSFTILDYPALPLIFFLAAAIGGVVMIFNILAHDRKDDD